MPDAPYHEIPEPPSELSATAIIVRMIDGLAFRYRWSLEGLDDARLEFRPSEGSMSLRELLEHIHFLATRLCVCFVKETPPELSQSTIMEIRAETLQLLGKIRAQLLRMPDASLAECKIVARMTGAEVPFWYVINGPLADALTHVGQINAWRRLAGFPTPKANVFLGKPPAS
jgi:hypothetical protein